MQGEMHTVSLFLLSEFFNWPTSVALPVCEDRLHGAKIIESACIFKDRSL